MNKLVFATNNPNKLKEVRAAFEEVDVEILSLSDIGCNEELPETTDTLQGNALEKAQYVADTYKVDCFADDTGLEVEALEGEPGVHSARYAGEKCSADDNMDKLLAEMSGKPNRSAKFRTVIALIMGGGKHWFDGVIYGEITEQKSGSDGFGYDPVFKPIAHDETFAEMSMEEKNKISHRGEAVKKMVNFISLKLPQ